MLTCMAIGARVFLFIIRFTFRNINFADNTDFFFKRHKQTVYEIIYKSGRGIIIIYK